MNDHKPVSSRTLLIAVLTVTAVILCVAHLIPTQPAMASESIKDRDYSLVTTRSTKGDEVVYVTENRTGQVAVFSWDAGRKTLEFRGIASLADAFR